MTQTLTRWCNLVPITASSSLASTMPSLMIVRCTLLQQVYILYCININSHFTHIFTSVVLTPTLCYWWFKKNPGWLEEWKDLPLKKICEQWATNYKPKPCVPPKTLSAMFPLDSPATLSNVHMLAFVTMLPFPFPLC